MFIFTYVLCSCKLVFWYLLASSQILVNLLFFIYNARHKNYFFFEYAVFDF